MDKARKQRLLGVLALVVLFGAYVGWSERPRILLHYSGQASAPIAYSYKEQGVETFSGEIRPGQVREFPVKLFGGSDYRIAFSFHRGEEKYASFSTAGLGHPGPVCRYRAERIDPAAAGGSDPAAMNRFREMDCKRKCLKWL